MAEQAHVSADASAHAAESDAADQEIAAALGVSRRSVASDWLMAKGCLYRTLRADGA